MATHARRKNETTLRWLRAASVFALTGAALHALHFEPGWGAAALALVAGTLTFAAVDLGVLTALVALTLPLAAANSLVGVIFLILGIAVTHYLGDDGAQSFLLVGLALAGAFIGPVWATAAIAGYLLGASEGAVLAGVACVAVEVTGLMAGRSSLIGTLTGGSGSSRLIDISSSTAPKSLFTGQWIADSFGRFGTDTLTGLQHSLASTQRPAELLIQALVWAGAACAAGALAKAARKRRSAPLLFGAVAAGTLVPAVVALILPEAFGAVPPVSQIAFGAATSFLVAAAVCIALDRVFPWQAAPVRATSPRTSMNAEDADVDELLRLISTAEEKLAMQHVTHRVVMLTDMKSFSKMTEEDGSILTAKAIQKHRDLLLPIIERHGGRGKSTGGDGLVASFESAAEAVAAACEMQQALTDHNTAHPGEREMTVRIGIADGEVVLDKGGRPFIGAALNLAARVMNLADGDQAFATTEVMTAAGAGVPNVSHGAFELKNIAQPVTVHEILWAPGQTPCDPRTHQS